MAPPAGQPLWLNMEMLLVTVTNGEQYGEETFTKYLHKSPNADKV